MGQSHCARFSKQLYPTIREMIERSHAGQECVRGFAECGVYDPMAGVGGLEEILEPFERLHPHGSEIEEEYAAEKDWIIWEDCRARSRYCRLIVTSPPYGNRMADQYLGTPEEQELRRTTGKRPRRNGYAIDLGRRVSPGSSAGLQWGPKYRATMKDIWAFVVNEQLAPTESDLIVNVASHFRDKEYMPVAEWTLSTLLDLGLVLIEARFVETPGNRDGQNRESRVGGELVYLFNKPGGTP